MALQLMENCTLDCIQIIGAFSQDQTCQFVQDSCVQDTVQFIQGYYCLLNQSFILLVLFAALVLLVTFNGLSSLTDDYLAPCVEEFIIKLNMSEALAGITFLAFANGAPDIITAVVAGSSSSDSTALIPFGSLYGGSLFSMAFILSLVIKYSPNKVLALKKAETLVPLGFYLAGTSYLLLVSVAYGKMNILLAAIFCSLYLIYIIYVVYEERKKSKAAASLKSLMSDQSIDAESKPIEKKMDEVYEDIHDEEEKEDRKSRRNPLRRLIHYIKLIWKIVLNYSVPPVSKKEWAPARTGISLLTCPLVAALAYGITDAFTNNLASVPVIVWLYVPSLILLVHWGVLVYNKQTVQNNICYSIYAFVIVVCWVTIACSVMINLLELLQLLTHINSVFLGLTILAWSNSIGDLLSITTFAKRGFASTAVAGIFTGQLTNFLLGFGLSSLVNSIDGEYDFVIFDLQGSTFDKLSDVIVISVIALACVYQLAIFATVIKDGGILGMDTHKFSKFYYVAFVLAALFFSVLTDFFKEVHCDL